MSKLSKALARLSEIRAREQAAARGPWRVTYSSDRQEGNDQRPMPFVEDRRGGRVARVWVRQTSHVANAHFVAGAREDIPLLLDALEEARALLDAFLARSEKDDHWFYDEIKQQMREALGRG